MRILILTPYYAPDLGPSASLYATLCEELVRLGHDVSVICAVPHYPSGQVPPEFRGRLIQRESRQGVQVIRIRIPSLDRSKLKLRLLSFLCYQALSTIIVWRAKCDVLIASNPAFEVAMPLAIIGFLRRKPFIYSVHEIYPDVGVKIGIFRNSVIVGLIERVERVCCRRAVYVRVISESYKQALVAAGISSAKIAVIEDWTDTDFIRPSPRQNDFSRRWGLDNCFVALYAGNIGPTQGLDTVIEAAGLLVQEPHIRFIIVGDGASRNELQGLAQSSGLGNVTFIPFQAREILPEVLASADVSLIALKKSLGTDSVPSKLFAILASGRPVLAVVESSSDIAKTILEAQCGSVVDPEDPEKLANAILDLSRNAPQRSLWAENARSYVLKFRAKEFAAARFQQLATAVLTPTSKPIQERLSEASQADV